MVVLEGSEDMASKARTMHVLVLVALVKLARSTVRAEESHLVEQQEEAEAEREFESSGVGS